MTNISNIKFPVISIIGSHAGQTKEEIFDRKIKDIHNTGITFWLMKSYKAKPQLVQQLCLKNNNDNYCIFIEGSSKNSVTPTKIACCAENYSKDKLIWNTFSNKLSPVTGKIGSNAYALVFDQLEIINDTIDLWQYADFFNKDNPIKIILGTSTICAIRKDMSNHHDKIKTNFRKINAIGRLCEPFCVYLK